MVSRDSPFLQIYSDTRQRNKAQRVYEAKELLVGGGIVYFHIIEKDPENTRMLGLSVEVSLWKGKEDRWRNLYSKGSEAIIS